MLCKNCGFELAEGAKFCPKCGASQNAAAVSNASPVNPQIPTNPQASVNTNTQTAAQIFNNVKTGILSLDYKKWLIISAALAIFQLISYFLPIFKINGSESLYKYLGMPNPEFSFADIGTAAAKSSRDAEGTDTMMIVICVVISLIAVFTVIKPLISANIQKVPLFIFAKLSAFYYIVLLIGQVSSTNDGLAKMSSSAPTLGLTFFGFLYVVAAIGIIFTTIMATKKMKEAMPSVQ